MRAINLREMMISTVVVVMAAWVWYACCLGERVEMSE